MKEIPLTRGYVALVDDADYAWLSQWKWHTHNGLNTFYAARSGIGFNKSRHIGMHREIMGVVDPQIQVDHKDRNGLNNTRENLRICTHAQNQRNSVRSKGEIEYRGVYRLKYNPNKFRAQIKVDNHRRALGTYDTAIEAAEAYDVAAIKYHGEFAILNFPKTKTPN